MFAKTFHASLKLAPATAASQRTPFDPHAPAGSLSDALIAAPMRLATATCPLRRRLRHECKAEAVTGAGRSACVCAGTKLSMPGSPKSVFPKPIPVVVSGAADRYDALPTGV